MTIALLEEPDAPTVEVAWIGPRLWSVYQWGKNRDSGALLGMFDNQGQANRAARAAVKKFTGHRLLLAGWSV